MSKPFCIVTDKGHAVRTDVLDRYVLKEGEISRQLRDDQFSEFYGQLGLVPPLYNPTTLVQLLEMNTYHYRCVTTKARDVAGLGWELRPLKENPSEKERALLDEFFSTITPSLSIVLTNMQKDVEAIGYGAIEVIREDYDPDNQPVNLAHIPAHTLRIHRDGNRFMQQRGARKRWFKLFGWDKDVDMETGEVAGLGEIPAERRATEILWFVNYSPRSNYYGMPDIIPAIGAVHGDISRRDYNISFFDNYGIPSYAVFITGNYDPGEENPDTGKTPLEESIESHFKEIKNKPHSTLILSVPSTLGDGDVKVEFVKLSNDVKEASFRLYRQDNMDEVLAAHGVPAYRLGITETGALAGNIAQEATEIYKRSVIEPRQEIIEAVLNRALVWGAFGVQDWEFRLAAIDTVDEEHDMKVISMLFDMGAMTPNQIIRYFASRFGLEPVDHPAMNAHYIKGTPVDLEDGLVLPQTQAVEETLQRLKGILSE